MNIIDTRDLYKRQCELQEELEALEESLEEAEEAHQDYLDCTAEEDIDQEELDALAEAITEADGNLCDWLTEYKEELDELNTLENEVGREWMHGTALIDGDDFEEYAQVLAEDLGMDRNQPWPYSCIDWSQAADELRQDYNEVEYQGSTYLFRA